MRIGLIHAVQVAIDPINQAFARQWPDAECMNVLDDRLSVDRGKSEDLTDAVGQRILRLAQYARDGGADAVLFTCSAFGPAIGVVGDNGGGGYTWSAATGNRISQNHFGGNGGLAIDLVEADNADPPHEQGDGHTLTVGTDPTTGNNGIDAPVVTSATTTTVSGTTCPTCEVEVYRAVAGAA